MLDSKLYQKVVEIKNQHPNWGRVRIAKELGCSISKARKLLEKVKGDGFDVRTEVSKDFKGNSGIITVKSLNILTLEDALQIAVVDLEVWEVERFLINSWETTVGLRNSSSGKPETFTNFQVKVWLKRKSQEVARIEQLLEDIRNSSPVVPKFNRLNLTKAKSKRELEVSLMDIHLGLRCYKLSGADIDWSPEMAEEMAVNMLDDLLSLSKTFGPFERIVFPMGNDFLHIDNVYATTTHGTPQPGSEPWGSNLLHAERLGFYIVDTLKKVAPVKIIVVPGNHARHTEVGLGRVMNAKYFNDKNVEVDATIQPYKFHHYGVNLIGFEHGHSIKQQVRLAALMANECRLNGWKDARFCEWHLGDQHRKGSGRPSMFEEQGVSIEFLPGLTAPNEWHKIHSFNWQKRAGLAYVWDKTAGPIARLQVNIDSYTGKVMK